MNGNALLAAFNTSNYALETNLDGIDEELALRLPPEGGNSINWILGHIIASRRGLTAMLGGRFPIPAGELTAYARGQDGRALENPLEWEVLRAYLTSSSAALGAALESVSAETLAAANTIDRMPLARFDDLAGVATFLLFHEGYHVGQIGILRRLFGREGRIG